MQALGGSGDNGNGVAAEIVPVMSVRLVRGGVRDVQQVGELGIIPFFNYLRMSEALFGFLSGQMTLAISPVHSALDPIMSLRLDQLRMVERSRRHPDQIVVIILEEERGAAVRAETSLSDRRRSIKGRRFL